MNKEIPLPLHTIPLYSLAECEDLILEAIKDDGGLIGEREVDNCRIFLSGFITGLSILGKISDDVRAVLHSVYVEGWDKYVAIEQFAPNLFILEKKIPDRAIRG